MDINIVFLAGSAAGATLTITTSLAVGMLTSLTAEAKAADLRKLYDMVEARHRLFTDKILPRIPTSMAKCDEFKGMEKRTFLLESYGLQLDEIEGKISCGGMYRWSPIYLRGDIVGLFNDLMQLNLNTLTTSSTARTVLGELLSDPEARKILYGEDIGKGGDKKGGEKSGDGVFPIKYNCSFAKAPSQQGSHDDV